jgi:hypothetical protein
MGPSSRILLGVALFAAIALAQTPSISSILLPIDNGNRLTPGGNAPLIVTMPDGSTDTVTIAVQS